MTPTIARILVPMDFSAHSDLALRYATTLASRFGASLKLLHVVDEPLVSAAWSSGPYTPNLPELRGSLIADANRRLTACRRTASDGVPVATTVRTGQPAHTIADYARTAGCDLIVMGTHGRTGLGHLLMGSVAEQVVRTAPCPVLTIRETAVKAEHKASATAA